MFVLSSNVLSNVSFNRFKQMVMILARLHLVLLIEESNFLGSPFFGWQRFNRNRWVSTFLVLRILVVLCDVLGWLKHLLSFIACFLAFHRF